MESRVSAGLDNLGALDIAISDADRAEVDKAVPPEKWSSFYEAEFGPHPFRV